MAALRRHAQHCNKHSNGHVEIPSCANRTSSSSRPSIRNICPKSPCRRVPHFLSGGICTLRTPGTRNRTTATSFGDSRQAIDPTDFESFDSRSSFTFSAFSPTLVGAKQLPRMRGLRQERAQASIRDSRKVPGCTTPRHPHPATGKRNLIVKWQRLSPLWFQNWLAKNVETRRWCSMEQRNLGSHSCVCHKPISLRDCWLLLLLSDPCKSRLDALFVQSCHCDGSPGLVFERPVEQMPKLDNCRRLGSVSFSSSARRTSIHTRWEWSSKP